jgi:ppGpp synthetase/RelA/SpoT-type nucleotidyltranferase
MLPDIRRALLQTETLVRGVLLDLSLGLEPFERVVVASRVKECDSAIASLRRRQPLGLFDSERASEYSLSTLRDLAAVRVMAFPRKRVNEAHAALRPTLSGWTSDPIPAVDDSGQPLAFKYFGKWSSDAQITAEIQIVGLLVGLFWEVEHAAIYKPTPSLHGVRTDVVIQRRDEVLAALERFESEFENAMTSRDQTRTSRDGD